MAVVDRNILRLAIFELERKELPAAVVIDEAIELARQFSNDESLAFINGVLDAIYKQVKTAGPV
jgi:transcription antitermination protein NusB